MEKICCDLTVAGINLRIFSDRELPFQDSLKDFYNPFDKADIIYNTVTVSNPDAFIPSGAKQVYSGSGMTVFELDGQIYHRYFYGGELSVVSIGEERTIYISSDESRPLNIQKSLALETEILDYNGIFMHASLIKAGDKGIIFSAPSGIGKSTQASLWAKHRGAKILNGDRAAIRFTGGKWLAYGSPWAGSSGIYLNESTELSAIVFLGQAPQNTVKRLSGARAFSAMMRGGIFPYWSKVKMDVACNISERLLSEIPVFEFNCTPDKSAVEELEKFI